MDESARSSSTRMRAKRASAAEAVARMQIGPSTVAVESCRRGSCAMRRRWTTNAPAPRPERNGPVLEGDLHVGAVGHPFGVGADDARRQPPGLALVELGLEVVDAVLELAGEPVGHARPLGLERLIGLLQRALRGLQALNGL